MMRPALSALAALALLAGCADTSRERYWNAYQDLLDAQGLARTDRIASDRPYSNADLVAHFEMTAFGVDPEFEGSPLDAEGTGRDMLRRWEEPVRVRIMGEVTPFDRRVVSEMRARIEAATRLDIRFAAAGEEPNLFLVFLSDEMREPFAGLFPEDGGARDQVRSVLGDDLICSGIVRRAGPGEPDAGRIFWAMAIIRTELPEPMRQSCVEEEFAQTMGLMRDDDRVAPSIFNEDDEFALLTQHDEYLLRILYDDSLAAGMERTEAMARVPVIVKGLRPGRD
jgi:hypothetical protein